MNNTIFKLAVSFFILTFSNIADAQVHKPESKSIQGGQTETKFPSNATTTKLTYKITNTADNTYCYDIFSDGKLMIRQPSIPGMPGNKGFKTKANAEKVAQLVLKKIKKGEMPPSVTKEEMQKVGALK